MLRRYVTAVVRRPRTVIALVVGVTLVLGFFVTRLRVQLDVDAQIPPSHQYVKVGQRVEKQFGGKYMTVIGFYPESGTVYTPRILAKVKRVTEALERLPGVKHGSVISLMSPRVKDVHSSEDSMEITPLGARAPETDAEVAAFRARVDANAFLTSLFVSDDGRATSVLVDFDDFIKAGGPKDLATRLEAIVAPEREPGLEILPAGAPTILHWLLIYTRRVALLFVLALAMIGYLHYRAFRTLQGMFVPLVTAIMGVLWALGLMGLIGAPMDPWNIMTPILLLAIGAGHSVQILKRYYEEYGRIQAARPDLPPVEHNRTAVIEATAKVGVVMLAAGMIASLSFGSLAAFGLPTIKNFGLCTAFGILAALAVEMTFIPAIRVLLSPPSAHQTEREKREEFFDPILEKLALVVRTGKERPILWAFCALIVVAAIGVARLQVGNSLGAQFFEANAPVHGFRMADSRLTGTRVIQVLVEGKSPDAIKNPDVLRRMDQLSTFIAHQPLPVGKVVSIVDLLRQMSRVVDPAAGGKIPDSAQQVAQFLLLYSMGGDEDDLSRLVDHDFQRAVITAYLRTDDFNLMRNMTTATQAEAKRLFAGLPIEVGVGGGVANAIALNEVMVHGKTVNLIQISILVLVITSLLLRSLAGGFLVLLPLGTAALVNLGLMGWTGIALSMGTAAISAMAIGIGADYAVYFLFRVREELQRTGDLRLATATALTTSGKAIAYVASAVAGGYLCLALSLFKVHVLLGVLVALTMVTSSAATVAFLPSVLLFATPKFLRRSSAHASAEPAVGATAASAERRALP
jgi:predicted RND superfamily exporter protein